MVIIDRYTLAPSPLISLAGRDQETANLQLQTSPVTEVGVVTGQVVRPDGTIVNAATVMLFTSDGQPFEHTNANPAGLYSFTRIPIGSYFITASEPGLLTPLRIPLTVSRNGNTIVNITMQVDPAASQNAIYGVVTDSITGEPVAAATVEVTLNTGTASETIGIVETNTSGQYLIANLDDSTYTVTASKLGFLPSQSAAVQLSNGEFNPLNILLAVDPNANTSTVSGLISDNTTSQPIPNALVALFTVSNGTETMVGLTKSNASGFYMFGDLAAGTYRIKSTVQVQDTSL